MDPASQLIERLKRLLDSDGAHAAGELLDDLIERFQLVPRADYERALARLAQLEARIEALERDLARAPAEPGGPGPGEPEAG